MIDTALIRLNKYAFRNIFIVEHRNLWYLCEELCIPQDDLVLCVDFGLYQQLTESGYQVAFLDHLIKEEFLQQENFHMHEFLNNWFKDKNGRDLLHYKGYDLGDSLQLLLINDITYFSHFFLNILGVNALAKDQLYVATEDPTILECLQKSGILYQELSGPSRGDYPEYFFPINKWVEEKTQRLPLSLRLKNWLANAFDIFFGITDRFPQKKKHRIYIQNYHPTTGIIGFLRQDKSLQLVLSNYTNLRNIWKERRVKYRQKKNQADVTRLLRNYLENKQARWETLGIPISEALYERVDRAVKKHLGTAISKAESIDRYFRHRKIDLMIPVTNFWTENRLIMNYCRNNNVPVFMIINGLLSTPYLSDGKDSDYVNCYSSSIRREYFNDAPNAFPLGDPRMDRYSHLPKKTINREFPVITIGTAGYASIDLNSYLAFEFDFLYDILFAVRQMIQEGRNARVVLKVRSNGYLHLYRSFVKEYFPDIDIQLEQTRSFTEVVQLSDLYISFFSQTVSEASCLGIPVLYYKKDTQSINSPYDCRSELVTPTNRDELTDVIRQFYAGSSIFDEFGRKEVMEKYVGPLSGENTRRNIEFIRHLLDDQKH